MQTNKMSRLDMLVRWNSTYILIGHVLYYKDVFIYFGEIDFAIKSLAPQVNDWDKLVCVHEFLKVFYDVPIYFLFINILHLTHMFWGFGRSKVL